MERAYRLILWCRSTNQADTYNEYSAAARNIACCIDLWCDVNKVIKTVQLIEQERASKAGKLKEDDLAKKARKDCLSNM